MSTSRAGGAGTPPSGPSPPPARPRPALGLAAPGHFTLPAPAQEANRVVVAIYHIAPGKQLDFLKWMAAREAIDREVGVGATQWYAHINGDSWDYVAISPDLDRRHVRQSR